MQDQKPALDAWFDEVQKSRWGNTAEVKRSYATASIVTAERIVFNVKGNAYRLVVAVDFEKNIVRLKSGGWGRSHFAGSPAEAGTAITTSRLAQAPAVQSCQTRPGTRANSDTFAVTKVVLLRSAWAAINTS